MAFHEGKACDAVIRVLEARLTSLSVAAYACGYLAVRALARALDRVTLFGRTDGHPGLVTLKAEQLHCVAIVGICSGRETTVGAPADWRKLLGVDPEDGTVLGLIEDNPFPRPALLGQDGKRTDLPPPSDDAERKQVGVLLQEARSYADGARLEVQDSERGGRGRDVFLIEGASERNLSDCGDDLCGQPARSIDGATVFYIRSVRP